MMDLSRIELVYKNCPGAGMQIHAKLGQKFFCVEFVMRDDIPQAITWSTQDPISPVFIFTEPWIQFAPKEWTESVEAIYKKIVEIWNREVFTGFPSEGIRDESS